MNTDTGEIFRNLTRAQLQALQEHDPRIVEVSKEVADLVEAGRDALTLDMGQIPPAPHPLDVDALKHHVERARISWHKKQEGEAT